QALLASIRQPIVRQIFASQRSSLLPCLSLSNCDIKYGMCAKADPTSITARKSNVPYAAARPQGSS
uniref:Phospholipase A(2) n=1 Tax=Macrostomum lignano TaxID=282301 RepID=A0A1I8FKN8_9PLAT